MKNVLLIFVLVFSTGSIFGQNMPQPSPSSVLKQTVGITEITIDYSRPSAKGRTIFGDLVPYGKVWRLGANGCTKITTSTDIMIGESNLKAGTYAIFAIPNKDGNWSIVFNTNTKQWGAGEYNDSLNVVLFDTKSKKVDFTETFSISINTIALNSATLSFQWENTLIEVPFKINTNEMVKLSITEAIKKGEDLDKVYYKAASYAFKSLNNEKLAIDYIDKSLAINKSHNGLFLKAQILNKSGKKDEAIATAKLALEYAKKAEKKGWADYISGNIAEWEK